MVIMALDHVRDYFHYAAFYFDPADPTQSDLAIFFTRWITHFCAPIFSFTAGLSAYLVGRRKSKTELSQFLVKRGIWLVFVELILVGFAWTFDIQFHSFFLATIWALGISMIVLAGLIFLPLRYILLFSLIFIFGHNLLDNVHFPNNLLWAILHEQQDFNFSGHTLTVVYPLIPWIATMPLGYFFGSYYDQSISPAGRKKKFTFIGLAVLLLFFILRFTNLYGDPRPFQHYGTVSKDIISFFNPTKYPPSLLYLSMTLGVAFLFLANAEKWKGKIVDYFCTFGRVPFFFYVLHIYLMHLIAMMFAQLAGFGWQKMMLTTFISFQPGMKGYGFSLWVVYVVWIVLILLLYPLCKKFDKYKQGHKEKKWLSYL